MDNLITPPSGPIPTPPNPVQIQVQTQTPRRLYVAIVLAIAAIAATVYFSMSGSEVNTTIDTDTSPPSLTVRSGGAKGSFIEGEMNLLQFEQQDIDAFKVREEGFKKDNIRAITLKSGVNYVYTEKEISFEDAVNAIDPLAGRIAVTMYDSSKKVFDIYPKGPFIGTVEVPQSSIKEVKIKAGYGFVVMAEKEANMYGVKLGTEKSSVMPTFDYNTTAGWQLIAVKDAWLADAIKSIDKERIGKIFAQKNNTEFEEVKTSDYVLARYLIWMRIKPLPKTVAMIPANTTPLVDQPAIEASPVDVDAPKITSISPNTAKQGDIIDVLIKGENISNTDISFSDMDLMLIGFPRVTSENIVIKIKVSAIAKPDFKKIIITSKDDKTKKVEGTFTVTALSVEKSANSIGEQTATKTNEATTAVTTPVTTPVKAAVTTATKIDPSEATQGEKDKTIVITGANIKDVTVTSQNAGIIIKSPMIVAPDGGSIIFKVDLSNAATVGATNFIVTQLSLTPSDITPIELGFTVLKAIPENKAPGKPSAIVLMQNEKDVGMAKIDPATDTKVTWTPGADDSIMQSVDLIGTTKKINYHVVIMNSTQSTKTWEQPWEIAANDTNTCAVQLYREGKLSDKKYWVCPSITIPKGTLKSGNSYTVTIEESDGSLTSAEATSNKFATSGIPGDITDAPKTFWNGTDKVTLVWNNPKDDGGSPVTDYEITMNTSGKAPVTKMVGSAKTTIDIFADDTPSVQNPLKNGTAYTFTIKAKNANGLSKNASPESKSITPKGSIVIGKGCNPPVPGENTKIAVMTTPEPSENFPETPVFAFASSASISQDPKINITGPKNVENVQLVKISEGTLLFCMSRFVLPSTVKDTLPVGKYNATISDLGQNVDPPDDADQKTADFKITKNVLVSVDNEEWVKGTIDTDNADGTYKVTYSVAGVEKKGEEKWKEDLALFDQHPLQVKLYQSVIAYSTVSKAYWGAIVKQINSDGTVNIQYKDKSGGEDNNGNVSNVSMSNIWMGMVGEDAIKYRIARDLENLEVIVGSSDLDTSTKTLFMRRPTFTISAKNLKLMSEYEGATIPLTVKISSGTNSGESVAILKGSNKSAPTANMQISYQMHCIWWNNTSCDQNTWNTSTATTVGSLQLGSDFKVTIYYDTYTKVYEKKWKV